MRRFALTLALASLLSACSAAKDAVSTPEFTPIDNSVQAQAMQAAPAVALVDGTHSASLWRGGRGSLLGDSRAERSGDILTVVIEIDEAAEISNATSRNRGGSEEASVDAYLGLDSVVSRALPGDASLSPGISTSSRSQFSGNGSVRRNESLELRIAATIVETLPNGVLKIRGSQEVRVNNELRELLVTGFVRPEDISRRNEITYDKIAAARIAYGGRGQISSAQRARAGQAVTDAVLPF